MDYRFEDVPTKITLPLDIALSDLKKYKRELPYNLYSLSSRKVKYLKKILAIIEGMEIPERMTDG